MRSDPSSSHRRKPFWKAVRHGKIEQIDGTKGKESKVSCKNPGVADASKATLSVFLGLHGNGPASNFPGK